MKTYYMYILASERNGTLYVGVTNDIRRRIGEHSSSKGSGFTCKYDVKLLVYFEETESIEAAIAREKQLKNWQRKRKLELIESINPHWESKSKIITGYRVKARYDKRALKGLFFRHKVVVI